MVDDTVKLGIDGDSSGYQRAAKAAQGSTDNIGKSVLKLKSPWLAVGAAVIGVGVALKSAVQTAAKFEDIGVSFRVLTGDADKAQESLKQLQDFAAGTPFQFEEVANAGKTFLAFGFEVSELTTLLQQTGDVAAATGNSLGEVALIYGQVAAAGKLTGERLLQLRERGVNVGPAIAEAMGTSEKAVASLVSKGKVSFEVFEKAFKSLSDEGGIAFGGLELKSQTLNGKLSTLADNWEQLSATIGTFFLPVAKDAVDLLTDLVRESGNLFKDETAAQNASKLIDQIALLEESLTSLESKQSTFDKIFGNEKLRAEIIAKTKAELADLNAQLDKLAQDELARQAKANATGGTNAVKTRTEAEMQFMMARGAFADELRQMEIADIMATDEEKLLILENNIAAEKQLKELARADELASKGQFLDAEAALNKSSTETQSKLLQTRLKNDLANKQAFFNAAVSLARSENTALATIGKAAGLLQIAQATPVAVAAAIKYGTVIGTPALGTAFGALTYTAMGAQAAQLAGIKGFADGGVIGGISGASTGSDDTLATVKTGEMILNANQQKSLFDFINGGALIETNQDDGTTQESELDVNININAGVFTDALESVIVTRRQENRTQI